MSVSHKPQQGGAGARRAHDDRDWQKVGGASGGFTQGDGKGWHTPAILPGSRRGCNSRVEASQEKLDPARGNVGKCRSCRRGTRYTGCKAATEPEDSMPAASDALIRCEQVGKCYRLYQRPADRLHEELRAVGARLLGREFEPSVREHWALRQVSFEVGAGETVAVIGRNGSGKSTLLQTIAGTLTPTEGTVSVRGRVSALLELGVGFHPEFSGLDNVRLTAAVLGFPPDALAARLDSIVAFADIGQYIHLPVKTYSSGMSVRLAFSSQSILNPSC